MILLSCQSIVMSIPANSWGVCRMQCESAPQGNNQQLCSSYGHTSRIDPFSERETSPLLTYARCKATKKSWRKGPAKFKHKIRYAQIIIPGSGPCMQKRTCRDAVLGSCCHVFMHICRAGCKIITRNMVFSCIALVVLGLSALPLSNLCTFQEP